MRNRYVGRSLLAAAVAVSLVLSVAMASPSDAKVVATTQLPPGGCAGMTGPEENHASIRLQVDQPAGDAQLAVDEHGRIAINGILHKHATMVDVLDGPVTSSDFVLGPPPPDVAAWAASWTTSLRPPHLGSNTLCARAVRDPKRFARIQRSFTVVDLIPPSAVPGLTVSAITATGAKVTWGVATDNYGLAGYEVTVDGGTAVRTTIGTRSYAITGLSPSTDHTVSVVAVDLAGNRSTTPATVSFTTTAALPPPNPNTDLVIDPQEGYATATWHPNLTGDVKYQALLDGVPWETFPLDQYCQDASGNPTSPCTAQDVISYPIGELAEGTPYTLKIQALSADGTQSRELSGTFTTLSSPRVVPEATVALISTESSRCAMLGGSFYTSPSVRGQVPVPADSTQKFDGCYKATNTSCFGAARPPSNNQVLKCADDITHVLYSVAPPGRGPVISAMEGTTTTTTGGIAPAYVPTPVMEPVHWCVEDPIECVEIIETAAEAGAVVAEAAGAAAVASFLVVAAAGIGLGLALGVLLAILWNPTPAAIGSLIEYPIHFDTNFDTFDNWGQGDGHWISSLKTYAEVIKTTKQVAAQQSLPFAWDVTNDHDLKEAIDLACGAVAGRPPNEGNVCPDNLTVYVPGGTNYRFGPMQDTGMHIVYALGNGIPDPAGRSAWFYPAYSQGGRKARNNPYNYERNWYDSNSRFNQNACRPADSASDPPRPVGKPVCDEFPFFSTNQAVDLSGITASLRAVPKPEQKSQWRDLGGFYRSCGVQDTDHFVVLPIQSWVQANGPSFAFQVNQGSTSLCLKPRP